MRLKLCPQCKHWHPTRLAFVICCKCRALAKIKSDPNYKFLRKLRAAGVNV